MATSRPLLYEVYLHAEHEEEERGVSPEEARAEESPSAATDGLVVEDATKSRVAMRLARRAARGAGGLAVRAARASLKLAGAPASVGAADASRSPVLAASARGAELVVAVGGVVRAFRDEDDFQRLLGTFRAPRGAERSERSVSTTGASSTSSSSMTASSVTQTDEEKRRVVFVHWAFDGSAFAAATSGGDVYVVNRLGDAFHAQTPKERRSRDTPVACFLALGDESANGNVYDLLVIARACDGGARECAYVQRVTRDANGANGANGVPNENEKTRTKPRVAAARLEGAPFARVAGAAWHEPSRTLAVIGENTSSSSSSSSSGENPTSSPGAGLWLVSKSLFDEKEKGALEIAAAPIPPRRRRRGAGVQEEPKKEKRTRVSALARFAERFSDARHPPAWCVAVTGGEELEKENGTSREAEDEKTPTPFFLEVAAVDGAGDVFAWRAAWAVSDPETSKRNVNDVSFREVVMNPSSFSRFSSGRAASVAWWSPGKLAVSFLDGSVAVVDVSSDVSDAARREETNDTHSGGDFRLTERFDAFLNGGGVLLAACPRPRGGTTTRETGSAVLETETERPRVAVLEFPEAAAEVSDGNATSDGNADPSGFPMTKEKIRWRVATMASRTPREALEDFLEKEDWEGAEALCAAHSKTLDVDDARKARFAKTPPRRVRAALEGFWNDIRDRAWAAVAAAAVVCDAYESQRVALEKALRETERFVTRSSRKKNMVVSPETMRANETETDDTDETDPNDDQNPETERTNDWSWWHRLRLVVLARLDRLDASHAARLGAFSAEAWRTMRAQSAEDCAISLAARNDARGAVAVARAFPRAVVSRGALLRILETFPETASVTSYEALLPWRAPWNEISAPPITSTRAGFRVGAHKFGSARVGDFVETGHATVTALLCERDGDEAYSIAALARAAGVSADALALAETQDAAPCAAWLLRSTEHVLAAAEAAEAARENLAGAKEFAWRPASAGEPGGDAGWALRRALRCDAAAGACDTAAELLADAASCVSGDDEVGAELKRVSALASTFAAAARDAPPPDPRAKAFRPKASGEETFVGFSGFSGFGFAHTSREDAETHREAKLSRGASRLTSSASSSPPDGPILDPVCFASLASFLDASPTGRLALLLADGARDFEHT